MFATIPVVVVWAATLVGYCEAQWGFLSPSKPATALGFKADGTQITAENIERLNTPTFSRNLADSLLEDDSGADLLWYNVEGLRITKDNMLEQNRPRRNFKAAPLRHIREIQNSESHLSYKSDGTPITHDNLLELNVVRAEHERLPQSLQMLPNRAIVTQELKEDDGDALAKQRSKVHSVSAVLHVHIRNDCSHHGDECELTTTESATTTSTNNAIASSPTESTEFTTARTSHTAPAAHTTSNTSTTLAVTVAPSPTADSSSMTTSETDTTITTALETTKATTAPPTTTMMTLTVPTSTATSAPEPSTMVTAALTTTHATTAAPVTSTTTVATTAAPSTLTTTPAPCYAISWDTQICRICPTAPEILGVLDARLPDALKSTKDHAKEGSAAEALLERFSHVPSNDIYWCTAEKDESVCFADKMSCEFYYGLASPAP